MHDFSEKSDTKHILSGYVDVKRMIDFILHGLRMFHFLTHVIEEISFQDTKKSIVREEDTFLAKYNFGVSSVKRFLHQFCERAIFSSCAD